jgi:hypothetical protein
MAGLVPGIHVFLDVARSKTWMAGTSPAMTEWKSHERHELKKCSPDERSDIRGDH